MARAPQGAPFVARRVAAPPVKALLMVGSKLIEPETATLFVLLVVSVPLLPVAA